MIFVLSMVSLWENGTIQSGIDNNRLTRLWLAKTVINIVQIYIHYCLPLYDIMSYDPSLTGAVPDSVERLP